MEVLWDIISHYRAITFFWPSKLQFRRELFYLFSVPPLSWNKHDLHHFKDVNENLWYEKKAFLLRLIKHWFRQVSSSGKKKKALKMMCALVFERRTKSTDKFRAQWERNPLSIFPPRDMHSIKAGLSLTFTELQCNINPSHVFHLHPMTHFILRKGRFRHQREAYSGIFSQGPGAKNNWLSHWKFAINFPLSKPPAAPRVQNSN